MNLNQEELKRYDRHLKLSDVGMSGQLKLKKAKVLVIGAGGLGCPVLQYLTAAGVGTIGIIDFDEVDLSNLQRQVLYTPADIGKSKALTTQEKLASQNSSIEIQAFNEKLTTENALDLFRKFDLIVDGTDNFSTRYLVNDACVLTGKPLVYGSIYKFEGQVSVFNYQNGPTYRCLFPSPPTAGTTASCSEVGVIGVLPGIIGAQQANEALKIILEIGDVLSGKILMYSALKGEYNKFSVSKSEEKKEGPQSEAAFKNFDYDFFCGIKNDLQFESINKAEFDRLKDIEFILDVREEWEQPKLEGSNVLNAPLDDLEDYISQIPKKKRVIVVCQKGGRSAAAIQQLNEKYKFTNLINLEGGLIG